jgi:hypothetical protein
MVEFARASCFVRSMSFTAIDTRMSTMLLLDDAAVSASKSLLQPATQPMRATIMGGEGLAVNRGLMR